MTETSTRTIQEGVAPFIEEFKTRYNNDIGTFAAHSDDPVKYLFKFNHEDGFEDDEIIEEFCRGTGVPKAVVEGWRDERYGTSDPVSVVKGKHPTVKVKNIDIDEEIAPLIEQIWSSRIDTMECCQHHRTATHPVTGKDLRLARISFHNLEAATHFVNLLWYSTYGDYPDELELLSDELTSSGFRIYVWFQGSIGDDALVPTVVVEIPTDELAKIAQAFKDF